MTNQIVPNLIYALLILLALLAPYVAIWTRPFAGTILASAWPPRIVAYSIITGAVILSVARLGDFSAISIILLLPLAAVGGWRLVGAVAAVLLFASVEWWGIGALYRPFPMLGFALLALGTGWLIRWTPVKPTKTRADLRIFALCFVVGIAAGLFTAPFEANDPAYTAWHHWGALLAPAEAWLAGGAPYRDFPIQYGLGPTTVLAAACGQDCWNGMYWTTIIANGLYFATLGGSAMLLAARLPRGMRWLALGAMFCATFLWTGFASSYAGPVSTPAVAGLRFLTISALLYHILHAERHGVRRDWIGHLVWLADMFWSPEGAFFGTMIWWPYLALRDAGDATDARGTLLALCRGAARGAMAVAIAVGALACLIWWLSGQAATPSDFFAYIQHPPGPRPVNPLGTIWLALSGIAIALQLLFALRLSTPTRMLYACLLGFLATISYYLSRSHDNNILNLFPFFVLTLLAIMAVIEDGLMIRPDFARGFIQTILAAIIAFVAAFNFGPWTKGIEAHGIWQIGPSRLIDRFAAKRHDPAPLLLPDAINGLEALRREGPASVLIFDERMIMPRIRAGSGWTGVNNEANFEPLPDPLIARYVRQGALAYRRPGWILIDPKRHDRWVGLFRTAYDVRQERRFGNYRAYLLVPRLR